nr:DUF1353 domain-containing protein [uncultured Duganella sp.]
MTAPLQYYSDVLGRQIEIEAGFLTDYASVPRIPFAYWLFGDSSHRAAVVHDWLYRHHDVCDRAKADEVLLEAMTVEGIPRWRRAGIYAGVVVGGRSAWLEDGCSSGHLVVDGRIV